MTRNGGTKMQSTKEKLEAYQAGRAELKLITDELKRYHRVQDTVMGSKHEHPYTPEAIYIGGINPRSAAKLQERKAELEALRVEVEEILSGVADPVVRVILRARFVKGLSWAAVANYMGGGNTDNSVRMMAKRFFEKD